MMRSPDASLFEDKVNCLILVLSERIYNQVRARHMIGDIAK
jgi:hypothetical protein